MIASAAITHYANAVRFARISDDIRAFWWQVSWRVPQFKPGTTLIAHYPNGGIRESNFVWAPASHIYYPTVEDPDHMITKINAIVLDQNIVINILSGGKPFSQFDNMVEVNPDPRHITILTQPTSGSCVQVIDGNAPEYSRYEDSMFMMIGDRSDTSYILTNEEFPTMPKDMFWEEPEHGWCYFYQKASLARQKGNWDEVLRLGEEIQTKDLKPDDLIEWMPFIQAYALHGDDVQLNRISKIIRSDVYVAGQVCKSLRSIKTLSPEINTLVETIYCTIP
jgi:hypothetical protein